MLVSKKTCLGILCSCCGHILLAQDISNKANSAFVLTGNVGTSANFYSSNETIKTRPTFAWNVFGNMEGRAGKWRLPLSFVINQYNNSNASPYVQIGISPTYEWARLHLGYRYIPFSPLTFEGQSFRGVGVELNPKKLRFAAFYGRLNRAANEDTVSSRFRVPQFSRTAYGVKAGVGNERSFFDLIYFHAKDDSTSATFIQNTSRRNMRPQENAVVGTSFKVTFAKRWVWTGDAAVSGLIQDLAGQKALDTSKQPLRSFIGKFLPDNPTLSAHYAGQTSLTVYTGTYSSNLGYRRVQPGFKSLGTPYMIDDVELVTWTNGLSAAQGKVNVSTNLSLQHNNLSKTLNAEMRTQVGNINVNTNLGQHLNVNLNASGYNFKQRNDRNELPDSLRLADSLLISQQILQYSLNPNYNITKGNYIHFVSGNITYQTLKDRNLKTAPFTNSNNLSSMLTYTLAFLQKPYSFSLSYLHSRYKQTANSYTSDGGTISVSTQLLKNKLLQVQGSFGYYANKFNSGTQSNTSYSVNAGYRGRHNIFSLFVNYIYTPPNNAINEAINRTIPYAVATRNLYGGITYTHLF